MKSVLIKFIKNAVEWQVRSVLNFNYDLIIASSEIFGDDGNIRYYIYGKHNILMSVGLICCIDTGRQFYNGESVYCAYINLFDLFSTKDETTIHPDIEKAILFNM